MGTRDCRRSCTSFLYDFNERSYMPVLYKPRLPAPKVLTSATSADISWMASACLRLSTNFDFDIAFFKVSSDLSMMKEENMEQGRPESESNEELGKISQ